MEQTLAFFDDGLRVDLETRRDGRRVLGCDVGCRTVDFGHSRRGDIVRLLKRVRLDGVVVNVE